MENMLMIFLVFILYSVFGYIMEVIICSFQQKKIVNRGYFYGPICPIYGVGALAITILLKSYYDDPIALFFIGLFICAVLEYFTSWLLEKIFHYRWWDYHDQKYHVNGRICLVNTIIFGVGAIAIIYIFNPFFYNLLNLLPSIILLIMGILILLVFLIDFIYATIVALNLKNRLIIVENLKNEKLSRIPKALEEKIIKSFKQFKIDPKRLFKAFPNIKSNNNSIELVKKILFKRKKK